MQNRQKHKITYTHFETICARKTAPKKIRSLSNSKSIEDDDHDGEDIVFEVDRARRSRRRRRSRQEKSRRREEPHDEEEFL